VLEHILLCTGHAYEKARMVDDPHGIGPFMPFIRQVFAEVFAVKAANLAERKNATKGSSEIVSQRRI
jgi:hypothetical protein